MHDSLIVREMRDVCKEIASLICASLESASNQNEKNKLVNSGPRRESLCVPASA